MINWTKLFTNLSFVITVTAIVTEIVIWILLVFLPQEYSGFAYLAGGFVFFVTNVFLTGYREVLRQQSRLDRNTFGKLNSIENDQHTALNIIFMLTTMICAYEMGVVSFDQSFLRGVFGGLGAGTGVACLFASSLGAVSPKGTRLIVRFTAYLLISLAIFG
ncbi:hypothetical protein CO180_01095 [candidate division WWE3 bacterium CG_4_9_14_3_um_filter_41_6]|uniref:Uncharacterized protein n=1 Tax=candidate division WWE3 bacterium CG_4_10_14_0_2_um_filter_41_14 TaxID=1975072 RepID=A0A2M7TKB3_UNCKA|nr:MAG: hypothetical protein COY32_02850 [candidate division WWE3 bacterium CG_4_10_14_0_2_um_filter_41_14]PJA39298.1 MAG: hypothetical protein CO180_01095 [candidate division WWE3 bacterium CG_4_9_14_3_um_filter_41_6]